MNSFQNIYSMKEYLKNVDIKLIDLMDKMLKKTPSSRIIYKRCTNSSIYYRKYKNPGYIFIKFGIVLTNL